jgi:photosystem II stability/assembly factor-like uncharacterized protein
VLRAAVAVVAVVCSCVAGGAAAGGGGSEAAGTGLVAAVLVPNTVSFWDAERGLIGSGLLYCNVTGRCASGAVSLTTDGGRTSRVLLRTAGPVDWVSVAAGGLAWAVVDSCSGGRGCRPARLLRSADGGRSWQHQPLLLGRPGFGDRLHGFALGGGGCEPAWCAAQTLFRSEDGGRSFRRLRSPCPGETQGVSPVGVSRAWLLCAGQPGVGNQQKAIYKTTDAGRTWTRLLSLTLNRRSAGGISWYGYALGISFNPAGVGLLWESRGTLYLTLDGGRRWKPLPTVARPEIDFGSSASVVPGKAFALLYWGNHSYRLITTTHGYRDWHTVRTWRYQPN